MALKPRWMFTAWLFCTFLCFSGRGLGSVSVNSNEFIVAHYNIKEMESEKIFRRTEQVKTAASILGNIPFDILSINEVQFDYPSIPFEHLTTEGQNPMLFLNMIPSLKASVEDWNFSFHPANTGKLAKKLENGTYIPSLSDPRARRYADPYNFGIFPGQYSSASLSHFKKLGEKVYTNLSWKDFNPNINLDEFRTALGKKFPSSMELFDKNLTHITYEVDKRPVHVILLHTVPSYHFGNRRSPNFKRNRDQLKFLEWYLTRSTDGIRPNLEGLSPIPKGDPFIAIGDLNVDIQGTNFGAEVLRSLSRKAQVFPANCLESCGRYTQEDSGFKKSVGKRLLDYIIYSHHFEKLDGTVLAPNSERKELGCFKGVHQRPMPIDGKVIHKYTKRGKTCYLELNKDYYQLKKASDHYPLWVKLKLK